MPANSGIASAAPDAWLRICCPPPLMHAQGHSTDAPALQQPPNLSGHTTAVRLWLPRSLCAADALISWRPPPDSGRKTSEGTARGAGVQQRSPRGGAAVIDPVKSCLSMAVTSPHRLSCIHIEHLRHQLVLTGFTDRVRQTRIKRWGWAYTVSRHMLHVTGARQSRIVQAVTPTRSGSKLLWPGTMLASLGPRLGNFWLCQGSLNAA